MAEALAKPERCRDVPGAIDILKVASALVTHAVDAVLMGLPCWDFYDFDLTGRVPNGVATKVRPRPGCPLCGAAVTGD
jgi:hypothetical protein